MSKLMDSHRYDDIIDLPHHVSDHHKHMDIHDRAAQFAPFAALTGHKDAIYETARLTDSRIELDENKKAELDEKLQMILERLQEQPQVTLTYFVPDERKTGGAYVTEQFRVKKIDQYKKILIMTNNVTVTMKDIIEIEV